MIRSFADRETKKLFETETSRRFRLIARMAVRKLTQIDTVSKLSDVAVPPGKHLEALLGDRLGQHSIRINRQWRVCFQWEGGDAYEVEITNYH